MYLYYVGQQISLLGDDPLSIGSNIQVYINYSHEKV